MEGFETKFPLLLGD
jgi:hypothetical protein